MEITIPIEIEKAVRSALIVAWCDGADADANTSFEERDQRQRAAFDRAITMLKADLQGQGVSALQVVKDVGPDWTKLNALCGDCFKYAPTMFGICSKCGSPRRIAVSFIVDVVAPQHPRIVGEIVRANDGHKHPNFEQIKS